MKLEDSSGYLVYMINQRMYNYLREKFEEEGVNLIEAWILLDVLNGVETVSELKKNLKADMALIQRACDRLEAEGLLTRTVSPYDKRVKKLGLTEEGRTLRLRLTEYAKEVNRLALKELSEKERDTLHHLLLKVYEAPFCSQYKIK